MLQQPCIRVHCLGYYMRSLAFDCQFYANRAGLVKTHPDDHVVVLNNGDTTQLYLDHLRRSGLGPKPENIHIVEAGPDDSLIKVIQQNRELMETLRKLVQNGYGLECFDPDLETNEFIHALGLDPINCFYSNKPEHRAQLNSKVSLRKIDPTAPAFLPWKLCRTRQEICMAIEEIGYPFVSKLDGLASGDGIELFISPYKKGEDNATRILKGMESFDRTEVLIEQALMSYTPLSVQWYLTSKGCFPKFASIQLMNGNAHCGNIMYFGECESQKMNRDDAECMFAISQDFAQALHQQGARGHLGFDFLKCHQTGQLYLLEANSRITAPYYPYNVFMQLERENGVVISKYPSMQVSAERLFSVCSDLFLKKGDDSGLVVYMLEYLPEKFGVISIASSEREAERLLSQLQQRCQPVRTT